MTSISDGGDRDVGEGSPAVLVRLEPDNGVVCGEWKVVYCLPAMVIAIRVGWTVVEITRERGAVKSRLEFSLKFGGRRSGAGHSLGTGNPLWSCVTI